MFWLTRPPYLRWMAAIAIVVGAAVWDLSRRATEPFPFAGRDIVAGEVITEDAIDWREAPAGLLERPDLSKPIAARDVAEGEPITPTATSGGSAIPAGWWAVPVALPSIAAPGTRVRLVVVEPPLAVEGVVVAVGGRDLLSVADAGLVAVPGESADAVARAAAEGGVVALVEP